MDSSISSSPTPLSLSSHIAKHLQSVPGTHSLNIYAASSALQKNVRPIVAENATTQQDHIILLSQKQVNNGGHVLVYGLAVSEYTYTPPTSKTPITLVYLEKIDSSGYGSFPHSHDSCFKSVPCALIDGYLRFLDQTIPSTNSVFIHVFALAQPQYLFPNSASNSKKHILTDQQLVKWWKKTLQNSPAFSDASQGWWFIPDEESFLAERTYSVLGGSLKWNWGMPFPTTAKAWDCIPQFEDDAKTKVFNNGMVDKTNTVAEFMEVLGSCGEFRGRRGAVFMAKMRGGSLGSAPDGNFGDNVDVKAIFQELMATSWKNEEEATASSQSLLAYLKTIHGVQILEVVINNPNSDIQKTESKVTINNLQGLIKKKPVPSVNNLQGLVRKSGPTIVNNLQSLVKKSDPQNIQGLVRKKDESPQEPLVRKRKANEVASESGSENKTTKI